MAEVVRCPYCVEDNLFKVMVNHVDGRCICGRCGHVVLPGNTDFHCACSKCKELMGNFRKS